MSDWGINKLTVKQRKFIRWMVEVNPVTLKDCGTFFLQVGIKEMLDDDEYFKVDGDLLNKLGKKYSDEYKQYLKTWKKVK